MFLKKSSFSFIAVVCFLLIAVQSAVAQNWEKRAVTDNWGDETGYMYMQVVRSGIAHGDENVNVTMMYFWTHEQGENSLIIYSQTIGDLEFHPAAGFLDESITLSLRDSEGQIVSYGGATDASAGNFDNVYILVTDSDLIAKLRGPGHWDLLVEGDDWYIRSTIDGNLPQLE